MQRNARLSHAARSRGITLIELVVTLALLVIVFAIAIPAFYALAASNQQTAEINGFVRHLALARSSAVKAGRDYVLCPSSDLSYCQEETNWQQGFILFQDRNEDGLRNEGEPLVKVSRPTGKIGIAMSSTAGRTHITFRASGRSAGSNLTLTFCDPEGTVRPKAVILPNSGRARISTTRPDGTPLSCGE